MNGPRSGYMPTLDGWRAIAALTVFFSHCISSNPAFPQPLRNLGEFAGWNSVSLFFGISGLLITSRLLEEREAFGQFSLPRFYVRRICRILPPAWIYLMAVAILIHAGAVTGARAGWLGGALFYRNYIHCDDGRTTMHFWSLAIEEHFYLTWPVLLFLLGNRRSAYAAGFLCALIFLWRWIEAAHFGMTGDLYSLRWLRTDTRLDALLLPALLAVLLRRTDFSQWFSRSITSVWWARLLAAYIVTLLAPLPLFSALMGSLLLSLQASLIPVLLAALVLHPEWRLSQMLELAPLRWLGRVSYSVYLWQQLFASWWWIPIIARLAATIGIAAVSYYAIERPFIRLGHRLALSARPVRADLEHQPVERELVPSPPRAARVRQ